jgi:cell division transport system permease protein
MMGVLMAQSSNTRSRRGAADIKFGLIAGIRSACGHHLHTIQDSFNRLAKEPLQTIMTTSVIAIALSLPATLFVTVDNARQLGSRFESFSQITAYLASDTSSKQVATIKYQLEAIPEVKSVVYISPDQALEEFVHSSGFGSALEYLEVNPLPPVFIITPKAESPMPDQASQLVKKIKLITQVEDAQLDMLWLQRLQSLTQIGQKIVLALGAVLGIGVLVIIGNSIRLAIHSRRQEIIVIKLVGGTDAYVRRPFLYSGLLMGLMGAMGASLILVFGFWWLGASITHLSELYGSQYRFNGPGLQGCMLLIATGGMLGLSGSWLAVGRHLKGIKPR